MRVLINLIGNPQDISNLKEKFDFGEWKIMKKSDEYFLYSTKLDKLTEYDEIHSAATQFLDFANGFAVILFDYYKELRIGSIHQKVKDGVYKITKCYDTKLEVRKTHIIANNDIISEFYRDHKDNLGYWFKTASEDVNIKKVLHHFKNISWSNLYKIYEIINMDIKGQKDLYQLVPKSKIKNFTNTVNSPKYIGDDSRHANDKNYKMSGKPMTFGEANKLIKELFIKWIEKHK